MRTSLLGLALAMALAGSALAQAYDPFAQGLADHVVGVTGSGADLGLRVVVDLIHNRPRILKVGDTWQDGWVLKSLTPQVATLTKGSDTKRIGLVPGAAASAGEPAYAAAVARPSADVQFDIDAGDVDATRADGGTTEQIWAAMRISVANVVDSNAEREFDNLDPIGPDRVIMGSVLPGSVGPNTPGAQPGYISVTGYILGKDKDGHFVFYRTPALAAADGNTTPIE